MLGDTAAIAPKNEYFSQHRVNYAGDESDYTGSNKHGLHQFLRECGVPPNVRGKKRRAFAASSDQRERF